MKYALIALALLKPQSNMFQAPAPPALLCAILDYPPPINACGGNGTIMTSPGGNLWNTWMMSQVPCFSGCTSIQGTISQ